VRAQLATREREKKKERSSNTASRAFELTLIAGTLIKGKRGEDVEGRKEFASGSPPLDSVVIWCLFRQGCKKMSRGKEEKEKKKGKASGMSFVHFISPKKEA